MSQFRLFGSNDLNAPVSVNKPEGYAYATGVHGVEEMDTKMCCHCGQHFEVKRGSGKIRGKCFMCDSTGNKWTCGSPQCDVHMSIEKRFDLYEKGRMKNLMDHPDSVLPIHKRIILE